MSISNLVGWLSEVFENATSYQGNDVNLPAARVAPPSTGLANTQGRDKLAIKNLENRISRQALVIQTLVAAIIEGGVISGEKFKDLMVEIDMSDGVRDGMVKENRDRKVCPSCERVNSYRAVKCLYCSSELGQGQVI